MLWRRPAEHVPCKFVTTARVAKRLPKIQCLARFPGCVVGLGSQHRAGGRCVCQARRTQECTGVARWTG